MPPELSYVCNVFESNGISTSRMNICNVIWGKIISNNLLCSSEVKLLEMNSENRHLRM